MDNLAALDLGPAGSLLRDNKSQNSVIRKIKRLNVALKNTNQERSISSWTIESIRAAIEAQVSGDFSRTSVLARSMLTDSAFSAALDSRVAGVTRSEFSLIPLDDTAVDRTVAEAIESIWFSVLDELTLSRFIKQYHLIGVALAFADWTHRDRESDIILPRITLLDTEFLSYDTVTSELKYTTDDGSVTVTPGDGNWIMMSKWDIGEVVGAVSHLGVDWINKQLALADWSSGNETHQSPMVAVSESGTGLVVSSDEEDIDSLISELQVAAREKFIYLPPGKSISTIDTNSQYKPEAFRELIEFVDRKYTVSILGGNLSSEVASTGANRAAAEVHNGVKKQLIQSDVEVLSSVIRDQLVRNIVEANFGSSVSIPWPSWSTSSREDPAQLISALTTISQLTASTHRIKNIIEIASRLGIELEQL